MNPSLARLLALTTLCSLAACSRGPTHGATAGPSASGTPHTRASASASGSGLTLTWELGPEVVSGRVPTRVVRLRFRNTSDQTIRVYLPQSEPFRAQISDVSFTVITGPRFSEPEPHPHGYVVSEVDFPAIAPGEEKVFTQSFTLDPFGRGGAGPARRVGFEKGKTVAVTWRYQNHLTSWPGGANTLDGVTKPLFGGGPIPGLWTGELDVRGVWTIPD